MKTVTSRHALFALACVLQATMFEARAATAATTAADPMPQTLAFANCSWDHPGVNPFMGDVVAAVDRYRDIPQEVRERLKARMAKREYDDLVSIRRDSIDGRGGYDYGSTISEMHFGTHQLCHSVTRSSWSPQMQERGLVYCDSGHCILIPTVCRNVSRITRSGVGDQAAGLPPLLAAAPPEAPADGVPTIDWFGPSGAGMPADAAPLGGAAGGGMPVGLDGAGGGFGPMWGGALGGTLLAGAVDQTGGWVGGATVPGSGGASFGTGYAGRTGYGQTLGTATVSVASAQTAAPNGVTGTGSGNGAAAPAGPVPEPQSWSLLLIGIAAVASAALRRRS